MFIDKMVTMERDAFFYGTEIMRISPNGNLLSHMRAPYGKYLYADTAGIAISPEGTTHFINFNCIPTENIADEQIGNLMPVYYVDFPRTKSDLRYIVPLGPALDILKSLQIDRDTLEGIGLLELLSISFNKSFALTGHETTHIDIRIILRFMLPFIFLIFSLLAIAFGWSYRSRYPGRPPFLTLLCIPFFPVVIAFITNLYILSQKSVFAFIAVALGLLPSLVICIIFQSVVIIIALIVVAGRITE